MALSFARHVRKKGACGYGRGIVHHQLERDNMDQQQQNQDRLFMQYLLTQAGDARLSKIEARLNALEEAHAVDSTQDSLSTVLVYCIISCLLLSIWMTSSSNPDSPSRLDFKPIIKGFLRPVLLWLLDHD